jgi:hypothetical protein
MTLQQKQSLCKAMFGAMCEVMLDMYSNTYALKDFDPTLLNKFKNIKIHLERETKKTYSYIEMNGRDEMVEQYFLLTNVFEMLIQEAGKGEKKFTELILLIKEYLEGNVTIENGGQV